jgi:hypothetical protein
VARNGPRLQPVRVMILPRLVSVTGSRGLARLAVLLLLAAAPAAAQTKPPPANISAGVDLALVLAVDASRSIDDWEYNLQREGYVTAFSDPQVVKAIRSGPYGAIAVSYVEWSSDDQQAVLADWTLIRDAGSAAAFADKLKASERHFMARTSISGGVDFSVAMLGESGLHATRRAIDVSGDGVNNRGRPVHEARDDAVKAHITINGLAIINDRPQGWGPPIPLDEYYRDHVIGGPGAFLIVAKDFQSFGEAIRRKLVMEIAGCAPPLSDFCADAAARGHALVQWPGRAPANKDPS